MLSVSPNFSPLPPAAVSSISTCRVRDCRHAESHITAGHLCRECGEYGHGQYECGNRFRMWGIRTTSAGDTLPPGRQCPYRGPNCRNHYPTGHHCQTCDNYGGISQCQSCSIVYSARRNDENNRIANIGNVPQLLSARQIRDPPILSMQQQVQQVQVPRQQQVQQVAMPRQQQVQHQVAAPRQQQVQQVQEVHVPRQQQVQHQVAAPRQQQVQQVQEVHVPRQQQVQQVQRVDVPRQPVQSPRISSHMVQCPLCKTVGRYSVVPGENGDMIPDDYTKKMDNVKIPISHRKTECCICMNHFANIIFITCMHICICNDCVDLLEQQHHD